MSVHPSRPTSLGLRLYGRRVVLRPLVAQDFAAWSRQKRGVNTGKTWIKVKVDRVSMYLYPGNDELAVVTFEQHYSSNNLNNQMRKRQYWQREGGTWRIIHEGAA